MTRSREPLTCTMSPSEFGLFRDLIARHAGVCFTEENAFLLERRLLPRLAALGLSRFVDYYAYLQNPALSQATRLCELDLMFEQVATHETYFFRESYQLEAFQGILLPELRRKRPRGTRLTIWSAGCSTGEEPYTLAILILESGLFTGWDVAIVGSDLSRRAIAAAQAGRYGPSSFRQMAPELAARYFRNVDGRLEVDPLVRRMVTFTCMNLAQPGPPVPHEPFDVIFCRNVLIYFERAARRPLLNLLEKKLLPGGYLFLGHSESLLDLPSPFSVCHLHRQMVYRKEGA